MATTTIRISTATHATLRRLARAERRAIGQVVAEAIHRYDRQRALAERNASYAKRAADPVAWADWQAERASIEGTPMDGRGDDPEDDEGALRLTSSHHPDIASFRGAAGNLDHPLSWDRIKEIARDDRLASGDRREP